MFRWTVHLEGPDIFRHAGVAVQHKVYCFGGLSDEKTYTDQLEVHIFNTVSLRWVKLPIVESEGDEPPVEVPSVRKGHTAVLTEDVDIIYIWGGLKYRGYCNDLYTFDVNSHKWFKPEVSGTVPEARRDHSACVLGKIIYIFGGINKLTACTNDMFMLDTATMVWTLLETKGDIPLRVLYRHSATIIGTRMFVFGGQADQTDYNDSIRVFDTETKYWLTTSSAQLSPGGREGHSAFAYNGELYIFGGENTFKRDGNIYSDLWKLNPETLSWKKIEPKGKGPCLWTSRMCCCRVGDRIILSGGLRSIVHVDDLYILELSPSLKTLCKIAFIQFGLDQSAVQADIRWELAAMITESRKKKKFRCMIM